MARTHNDESRTASAPLNDSAVILPVEDGTGHGHYATIVLPSYDDSPAMRTALAIGLKYDALRKAQSVAKKAAKEGKSVNEALASFTFTPEAENGERIATIGTRRAEIASARLEAALVKAGQPHNEATVKAHLGAYMGKPQVAAAVDSELRTWLATGYTPTKRGEGAGKAGETAASIDIDSLE